MSDELYGYKPIYKGAVETVLNADPEILNAVHELLFSGYCPVGCSTPRKGCRANTEAVHRFSGLVKTALAKRSAA